MKMERGIRYEKRPRGSQFEASPPTRVGASKYQWYRLDFAIVIPRNIWLSLSWPVITDTSLSSWSSPSTILRCLNRVALSFLTSWILSVDFLTSTWSFLLNMIQAAGGRGDRNNHRRRRPGRSASMPGSGYLRAITMPAARGARCTAHPCHVKSASNFAYTPPIRCTWRPSWAPNWPHASSAAPLGGTSGQWHHPSSNSQFSENSLWLIIITYVSCIVRDILKFWKASHEIENYLCDIFRIFCVLIYHFWNFF